MTLETPESPVKLSLPTLSRQQILIIVIIVLALVPSVYFYMQYRAVSSKISNPTQLANDESKKLVSVVSKLMTLPEGEAPTVATVNDKEKLKNQPFFARTENGDKVLIYTNAKKAILYRPSINKIIDVAPVNIGQNATSSATPIAETVTKVAPKFTILNGTTVVGLTKKYESTLKEKIPDADVIAKDNAVSKNYEKTLFIDVSNGRSVKAKQYADALGLPLSALPAGEATPAGEFLILLGSDVK